MIADNWRTISERVARAAEAAKRDPSEITIVAVAKTHPASAVREAIAAGAVAIGENYAQELVAKRAEITEPVEWHFIGRLQRNKVKLVAGCALIHAVDSVDLAKEIAKRCPGVPVLLSVNVAGEATKGGVPLASTPSIANEIASIVPLRGLMTMPPPDDDPEPHFVALRAMREHLGLPILSMGMSDDFEVAIRFGATHVRIGTAIFGARG